MSYSLGATAIEVQGPRRARARSTLHELLRLKEGETGLHIVGTYTDEFAKINGEWRFTRRSFQLRYEDDVELPERMSPKTSRAGAIGTPR